MRLIDADALTEVPNVRKVTEYDESGEWISYLAVPVEAIKSAPTIEAEPVRHGRWIRDDQILNRITCSECKRYFDGLEADLRCPNCGAKMDLEEGSDRCAT